ncbi:MAG: xylose isomerase [Myxococcales bacterium]|nr:xylose isomerase [Myxococcales bacterium]
MTDFTPRPDDHFTFGLWTFGNPGRDPFGEAVRPAPTLDSIERWLGVLAEAGAYGVNLHDNDLVPFGAASAERDRIVARFRRALETSGLRVPMATTNLFSHPVFKDGAFTSADARVRAFALDKCMRGIELGVELGAEVYVFWGGREGAEVNAAKDPRDGIARYRQCIDYLCAFCRDRGYDLRFALEAKPNEPRGDIFLPTTGAMLAFIETLADPAMVGVNPEVAHEQMAGLDTSHAVAQALDAGKLFHIDLNGQKPGRFDQDLRFGSEDIKGAFFLVKLLEDARWQGMRHFDAHAYRTEDERGVRDFAVGCMRTYNILRHKARRFAEDAEIQQLLAELAPAEPALEEAMQAYSSASAERLGAVACALDVDAIGARGLGYERLDQLVMELLMGVR